ncbi:hypothetical protein ACVW06_002854 [Pantoea ananatis]|nr:hypothetical protein C7427_101868 [Pantoea ananatis]CRH38028.1 hypothetical protein BN1184_AV_00170 [Pantoea ananatis]
MEAQKGWLTLTICSSPLLFAFGHLSGHRLRPHLMPARENNGQQAYAAVILLRLYRAKPDWVTKKARSPIGPLLIHRSFTECLTPLFRQQFFTDDFCTGAEGTQLAPGNLTG